MKFSQVIFVTLAITKLVGCGMPPDVGVQKPAIEDIVAAPVDQEEINLAFERLDATDIVYALNEVKGSDLDFDVIRTVACAYENCESWVEGWNRSALSKDLVRINLIDVLVQAGRRGIPTVNEDTLLAQALEFLGHSNPLVVQRAMFVLSYTDDSSYVSNIASAAKATDNTVTFRVAIMSLRWMTAEAADKQVQDLLDGATEEQRSAVADLFDGSADE